MYIIIIICIQWFIIINQHVYNHLNIYIYSDLIWLNNIIDYESTNIYYQILHTFIQLS